MFDYRITVKWKLIDGTFLQEKIYNVVDILEDGIFIVDLKDDSALKWENFAVKKAQHF